MEISKKFSGRDFISLHDYTQEELNYFLDVADFLKAEKKAGHPTPYLQGKTLGMIFQKSSTRTRVSFETGMYYLGGSALFLSSNDLQIGRGEPIKDTARVLSRYLNGIMIRTYSHDDVLQLAEYGSIPIINGLTDLLHPCQVLADLQTIREYKGKNLKGMKMAFIGDGNNMAHSLMYGGAKMGMDVFIASPENYKPDPAVLANAIADAEANGGSINLVSDPKEAAKDADVIYTDVWASMGMEGEAEARMKAFIGYQVNTELMALAKKDAIVLHCLPAHREEEITSEIFEEHANEIFDEAENRLHAQMAVMALTMCDK